MASTPNKVATENDALLSPSAFTDERREEGRRRSIFSILLLVSIFLLLSLLIGFAFMPMWEHIHAPSRRQARIKKAAKALATLNKHSSSQIPDGCESTLLLIRHCEDHGPDTDSNDGSQHCSYLGHERTKYLATLFGNESRWPLPSYLYGLWKDKNMRQFETLQPLSQKASIETRMYTFPGISNLVSEHFELLQSKQNSTSMCGEVSVAAWKHAFIPEMAVALGCGPVHGCPKGWPQEEFDDVWELKYVFRNRHVSGTPSGRNYQQLVHQQEKETPFPQNGWNVYFSKTREHFDPLAYSKRIGNYV